MTDDLIKGPARIRKRVRGYLPCRLVTNRENKRGQVLLQFEDGSRVWMNAEKVDRS